MQAGGGGTWSLTQFKYTDNFGGGTGGTCATNICTTTIAAPSPGHLLVAVQKFNGTQTTTTPTGGQTWAHCVACVVGSTSKFDTWYVLSATATGQTTVVCTWNTNLAVLHACEVYEYAWSGSTISFVAGAGTEDAACNTCAAVTLTGTFNLAIQAAWTLNASAVTAISGTNASSYTNPQQFYSGTGSVGWINATSGTAFNWTVTGTGAVGVLGITFNGT